MKPAVTALLTVIILIGIGHGRQDVLSADTGQSSPPRANLHVAAFLGNAEVVRQHIEDGSDLNERDKFGSTPLITAATFGHTEVALALIEAGADLDLKNNDGSTALLIAAFLCRTEIVEALLENGADPKLVNNDGARPLDAVEAPFEDVRETYDKIGQALGPLGLELDYERIKAKRPEIAKMLQPRPRELRDVDYAPLVRDDWPVSTPEKQGLDSALVADLYRKATGLETIYGLLIVKNGHLVAEAYFNDGVRDEEVLVQSVSKSYISALVGIALEQGCISSLDQKMMEFFPEIADRIVDTRKEEITIRHLLKMRSGYVWEEAEPALWEALLEGDNLRLIADYPLVDDPGTGFNYSNLTSHLLGIIVSRACNTDLKAYAWKHLLEPIESGPGTWHQDKYGYYYSLFHFTARDMARFGLLYLNDGRWGGRQVVPAAWVRESFRTYSENAKTEPVSPYLSDVGYGYQWWSGTAGQHRFDNAWGHGGQLIVLLHELDMVIVVTSDPFWLKHDGEAWSHEKANVNLVSEFISSLPAADNRATERGGQ